MLHPLTTQIVGTYAKPHWLGRHDRATAFDGSWWRPEFGVLDEAKQDAVRLAVYDQERAGLDLITDGEAQRDHYVAHFLARLDGIDTHTLGIGPGGRPVPRIVGHVAWTEPMALEELRFLKKQTRRPVKATVVGPLTALSYVANEHYPDDRTAIMAFARVLNQEFLALDAAGVDLLQIDEPAYSQWWEKARAIGIDPINQMVEGVRSPVSVHLCYGYGGEHRDADPFYPACLELVSTANIRALSIEYERPGHQPDLLLSCGEKHVILGLLNIGSQAVETPEHIAVRLREALSVVPTERLHPSSDCGMWLLPRDIAFAKIRALVLGTEIIRIEHGL